MYVANLSVQSVLCGSSPPPPKSPSPPPPSLITPAQFRAVTGINVTVNDDEVLTLDEVSGGGKERATARSKKRARNSGTQSSPANGRGGGKADGGVGEEKFRPVCCSGCDHRVGVLDEEDVFHFFNVIASG